MEQLLIGRKKFVKLANNFCLYRNQVPLSQTRRKKHIICWKSEGKCDRILGSVKNPASGIDDTEEPIVYLFHLFIYRFMQLFIAAGFKCRLLSRKEIKTDDTYKRFTAKCF